jgi:hypothetical protein
VLAPSSQEVGEKSAFSISQYVIAIIDRSNKNESSSQKQLESTVFSICLLLGHNLPVQHHSREFRISSLFTHSRFRLSNDSFLVSFRLSTKHVEDPEFGMLTLVGPFPSFERFISCLVSTFDEAFRRSRVWDVDSCRPSVNCFHYLQTSPFNALPIDAAISRLLCYFDRYNEPCPYPSPPHFLVGSHDGRVAVCGCS